MRTFGTFEVIMFDVMYLLLLVQIDVKDWLTRTALEIIGTGGFGYSFDSFREGETPHPYCVSVKQLL